VIAGLRPEHFMVANGDAAQAVAVEAVVEVVEYLGDEQLAHLRAGDVQLVARLPIEDRLAPDELVTLALPPDKLYLFDAETESALDVAT
jgi:ABC-type sugar transport system ATPase subunit